MFFGCFLDISCIFHGFCNKHPKNIHFFEDFAGFFCSGSWDWNGYFLDVFLGAFVWNLFGLKLQI